MKKYFIAALLMLVTSIVFCIQIGGHITEDTTWRRDENPYVITSFLYIDANVTLTIMPGVQIQVVGADKDDLDSFDWISGNEPIAKKIIVHGRINAIGSSVNPIIFDKMQEDQAFKWGGIYISHNAPISTFEHCEFRNTFKGDIDPYQPSWPTYWAAICFQNGIINIRSCTFYDNYRSLYTRNLRDDLVIYDCKFGKSAPNIFPSPYSMSYLFFEVTSETGLQTAGCYKVTIAKCSFTGTASIIWVPDNMEVLYLNNTANGLGSKNSEEQAQHSEEQAKHRSSAGSFSFYGNVSNNAFTNWTCRAISSADTAFTRRNKIYKTNSQTNSARVGGLGYGTCYVSDNRLHGRVRVVNIQCNSTTLFIYNNVIESNYFFYRDIMLFDILNSTELGGQVNFFNNVVRYIGDSQNTNFLHLNRATAHIYNNHILGFYNLQTAHHTQTTYTNNIIVCNYLESNTWPEYRPILINNCLSTPLLHSIDGGGNFVADPLLAGSLLGNYNLLPESPCIDSGVNHPDMPDFDIRYHKRIAPGNELAPRLVDIGAYEYNSVYIGGINGYVYDSVTGLPVDCVKVEILGTLPEFSDTLGMFQYPTGAGRYTVKVSRWDYQDLIIPNVEVFIGVDTILNIPLLSDNVDSNGQTQSPLASMFGLNNYPNPFNPNTNIGFIAPEAGDLKLSIFNIRGQRVKELYSGSISKGYHSIAWDGVDDRGVDVSSGVYFVRIEANGRSEAHKMMLMK